MHSKVGNMNLSIVVLDLFRLLNYHVVDDCFTEMLSHWLEHSTPKYTKLVEALTSPAIDRMDIAEKVKAKWGKQN